MQTELTKTLDGSYTLYVPEIDEHYHSINGAIQESNHVFINAGLKECAKDTIHVLEVGFGTGLNTFLTMLEAEKSAKNIFFTTIELYPIDENKVKSLQYAKQISTENSFDFERLHTANWNETTQLTTHFTLKKNLADFTKIDFDEENFDVIFFDAFSPEKQPEMWTENIFTKLYNASSKNAILTTYCAKGMVRRAMQKAGYLVERISGPPGKREMIRCRKI